MGSVFFTASTTADAGKERDADLYCDVSVSDVVVDVDAGLDAKGDRVGGTHAGGKCIPVVMLHSLFFDCSMFEAVQARLRTAFPEKRITFLTPDHRGQGRSPIGVHAPSMEQLATDTIAMIEQLAGAPVHLVGSSMGGYVALSIARRRPDLLLSCVLSCCTAHAERQPARFAALEAKIREEGTANMGAGLLQTMFGERFVTQDDVTCRAWRERFEARGKQVADAVHGVFARDGYEPMLDSLRMPVLLFSGELDRAKRPEDMAYIAERVPGSRHVVVPDSGHTPPVENPDMFAAELARFWRETVPDFAT
jgi:3-oxoadipate enol-lactonase